jgi:hypothetical protein
MSAVGAYNFTPRKTQIFYAVHKVYCLTFAYEQQTLRHSALRTTQYANSYGSTQRYVLETRQAVTTLSTAAGEHCTELITAARYCWMLHRGTLSSIQKG